MERPLLVYDGDCGFCVRWIERWRRQTGGHVDYAPYQQVGARFPDVGPEQYRRSVWLFEPDGTCSRAAEAVVRALAAGRGPGARLPLLLYRFLPGVKPLMERTYDFVASHRAGMLRVDQLLVGRDVVCPEWRGSRTLFRVALGLVGLIAFLSLWVQLDGLAGSHGIAPAAPWLEAWGQRGVTWRELPTLAWLDASDGGLHRLCGAGVLVSALLLLDVAPALCALLLWALYLSLIHVCNVFLQFQWDSLLVECCLLAAIVLPWRLVPARWARRPDAPPGALGRALLWWLLFRFMFESGVVKLTQDGNGAWHDLSALSFHYMTQPLPNPLSWFAWRLPLWAHEGAALSTFAIEIGAPFLILGPRRLRQLGCLLLLSLQVLIFATGNYGFFNLLTITLCLTLLDDQALASIGRRLRLRRRQPGTGGAPAAAGASCSLEAPGVLPPWTPERPEPALQRGAAALYAAVALLVGLAQLHDAVEPAGRFPISEVSQLEARLGPFLSLNGYGLFRTMTLTRPEIVVQGSADGETWVDYEFRYKPDRLDERPRWVQPHMPRLDWRLWFEALAWEGATNPPRPYQPHEWFASFLSRLLEGEPAVVGLLASDPFEGRPPRAVRATLYDYRFAEPDERRSTGQWWTRQRIYPDWLVLSR